MPTRSAFVEVPLPVSDGRPTASCPLYACLSRVPHCLTLCPRLADALRISYALPYNPTKPKPEEHNHTMTQPPAVAFEASIFDVVRTALRITRKDPRLAYHALRLLRRQQLSARRRDAQATRGLHVPPFLIYSITAACNLSCAGCYANLLHTSERAEMDDARIERFLAELEALGSSVMLIAGGEPLLRPGLLEITAAHPRILFLLFTNGALLDEDKIGVLQHQRHVIPVLSIEGSEDQTDFRRGNGTHGHIIRIMRCLRERRVFFGTSTTLTRENFELATSEAHLQEMIDRGCRLFYFINYVPVQPGTDHLQLETDQVRRLEERLTRSRRSLAALFIAFPHDEVALGGCLAAGRGFVHINAYGDVEPCPFSPYSDRNLNDVSFEEALSSPLLRRVLDSGIVLDETDGRCALWKKREWVRGLLAEAEKVDGEAVPPSPASRASVSYPTTLSEPGAE